VYPGAVSTVESTSLATAGMRVPDFFIVGHHKSGTTALYEMLRAHPQIFMPALKEPRFLATDLEPRFAQPREHVLPQTLEEYLSLFRGCCTGPARRRGNCDLPVVAQRRQTDRAAAAGSPHRCDPARARDLSALRAPPLLRARVESQKNLAKAMSLEAARASGRRIPRRSELPNLLQYSDHSRYVEQLNRYHEQFPREQVLVLIYDDFLADDAGTVRQVLRFLDVDDMHPIDVLARNVTKHTLRSHQADEALRVVTLGRGPAARLARAAVKSVTTQRLRKAAEELVQRRVVMADARPPDERFMDELRRRFKSEVITRSEYLDRDLVALWGYDKIP
jgi:hypothetical protein